MLRGTSFGTSLVSGDGAYMLATLDGYGMVPEI
jgi:hypothetical protein